jgi:selenocysteine-specific elongation factor
MQALAELESGEGSFIVQKLAELGCVKLKDLEKASGLGRERITALLEKLTAADQVCRIGDQWVTIETARAWQRVLVEAVENYHRDNALLPGIPHATLKATLPGKVAPKAFEQLLGELIKDGQLTQHGEWVSQPDFTPKPTEEQAQLLQKLERVYLDAGFGAKGRVDMLALAGVPEAQVESLLAFLFANGILVRLNDDSLIHRETYQRALEILKAHFAGKETLTLAEFRDLIGSARKQTQAILELFDSFKYTIRKGDERVAWQLPG